MSRLDALIEQLVAQHADALLMEAGNSLFLLRGTDHIPLINAKLTNEHVADLLRDVAPPDARGAVDKGQQIEFEYSSPSGPMHIELATFEGRFFARLSRQDDEKNEENEQSEKSEKGEKSERNEKREKLGSTAESDERGRGLGAAHAQPAAPLSGVGYETARPAIESWFDVFLSTGASDLHLTAGLPAMVRNPDGEMRELVEIPAVEPHELEALLMQIMPLRNQEEWTQTRDTDFAYNIPHARLRCNVFYDLRGPCAVFRRVPSEVLTVEALGLPPSIIELCKLKKGLVLVTGPTGSGKSTTIAAMVDWINENRADHIVTIEDPIEFVHSPKRCLVRQREVGVHTTSFARALRAALREDPDIVLVGELRDLETMAIAIEVAETGHLVLGTLHTTTAHQTVDRIVDQFNSDKQEQVRQMLAEGLKGVICQTLCKRKDGGRALALEVLLVSNAVANMIREKKTFQIPSVMQTSRGIGMRTLNESLVELVKNGIVAPEEALDRSSDRAALKRDLVAAHLITATTEA